MEQQPTPLPPAGQASPVPWRCPDWRVRGSALVLLLTGLILLFREFLILCVHRWTAEPQYAHGFAVAPLAVLLAWILLQRAEAGTCRTSRWGPVLLLLGLIGHLAAVHVRSGVLDAISFVAALHGCVLTVAGRRFWGTVWPAVMYVACLLPLPVPVERFLSEPMLSAGLAESVYFLRALGCVAMAQPASILLERGQLDLTEVFSGLRMMHASVAVCLCAAVASTRPRWERVLIFLSAFPLAFLVSVLQTVVIGAAWPPAEPAGTGRLVSQLCGWTACPVAGLLLCAALRLFDWILPETDDRIPGGVRPENAVPGVIFAQPRRAESVPSGW